MTDLHLWLPNSHVRMPYVRSLAQVRICLYATMVSFADLIRLLKDHILRRHTHIEKTYYCVGCGQVPLRKLWQELRFSSEHYP